MARPLDACISPAAAARHKKHRTGKVKLGKCILSSRADAETKQPFSVNVLRLREIEQLIVARHGQFVPETDDADLFIKAAAYALNAHCRRRGLDFEVALRGWCNRWCPWVLSQAATLLRPILHALRSRRLDLGADEVAGLLNVTLWERNAQEFRSIGACDVPTEIRKGIARNVKRDRDRERQVNKRRAAGVQPRKQWEAANSLSKTRPWEAEGISRAQWYRRHNATGPSRLGIIKSSGDTLVSSPLGAPFQIKAPSGVVASFKSPSANDDEPLHAVEEVSRRMGVAS
ncbi:hypothetical protein J1C56_09125 [Aminobacter anthyllidis]|uniref:Uncharacterized protein n=1 Tax=Aminobacter anthyllidis TaxID=1035067 RepID=A0A9X1A9H0_9HYPH|nr:hypothetical protein [Aminobacter anthyllidis]MBT1155753.1 hypothetical protein [Aminobacter anthyllidis]